MAMLKSDCGLSIIVTVTGGTSIYGFSINFK